MTRGKHGRAMAQKRAASAEEQLDRLLPKLVDTERQLKMYRSEAEAAPILRAELARLRDVVGVPQAEHERIVTELETKRDERIAALVNAMAEVVDQLSHVGSLRPPTKEEWLSAAFVQAIQQLPKELALDILAAIGQERDFARSLYRKTWMHDRMVAANTPAAQELARIAKEAGYPEGKIPRTMTRAVTMRDVLDGTRVIRPDDVQANEDAETDE